MLIEIGLVMVDLESLDLRDHIVDVFEHAAPGRTAQLAERLPLEVAGGAILYVRDVLAELGVIVVGAANRPVAQVSFVPGHGGPDALAFPLLFALCTAVVARHVVCLLL